jgi:hypothetical protein
MAQTWTKLAEAMERLEPHQARYEERGAEVLRAVPRER